MRKMKIIYRKFKKLDYSKREISALIAQNISVQNVLANSCKYWDGGYTIAGMLGHGDAFVFRDPAGIRPAYYYKDDEVVVAASERPVIQTTFNVALSDVHEVKPGYALIIKKDGSIGEFICKRAFEKKKHVPSKGYISQEERKENYNERKKLGKLLCPAILKAIDYDIENTVFSYIPNTAAAAYYGMWKVNLFCDKIKKEEILKLGNDMTEKKLEEILSLKVRIEKVAVKDVKIRTFITDDDKRNDLAAHVYDITYGSIRKGLDNLVVIDDSIVRGTTLKQSIINILDRSVQGKLLLLPLPLKSGILIATA